MSTETVETPASAPVAAPVAPQQSAPETQTEPTDESVEAKPEGETKQEEKPKPEETPEQKELRRLRNGYERQRTNAARLRAELEMLRQQQSPDLTKQQIGDNNQAAQSDSDELRLSRAEAMRLIQQQAERLAPEIAVAKARDEGTRTAAQKLRTELGSDRFTELTDDLASIFDAKKQLAVLRSADPAGLLQYLTDIDNADEAGVIAGMDEFDTGAAFAAIALKIKAQKSAKPEQSKAAPVIEPVKGQGAVTKDPSNMTDAEFAAWRRRQIAQRN